MDMDDLLNQPRAFRLLLALTKREPMNQRQFTEASLHAAPRAQALREWMQEAGLLTVRELSGHGNAGVLEIRLSPLGRDLAGHLAAMEKRLSEKGRK